MTHDEVVIARRAIEEGRGLVVIVNKMDLLEERLYDRVVKAVPEEIQTIIPQVGWSLLNFLFYFAEKMMFQNGLVERVKPQN